MAERVDFSNNAGVYDRRHGAVLPPDVARRLMMATPVGTHRRVLDVGAGTGRVAIALAELGYDVIALEPAMGMMDALRTKAAHLPIHVVVAEGAALPFAANRFDVLVLARILYLARDWRLLLSEARRVLAPGAYLLHEWGNGEAVEEWVQIRERARELFEEAGVKSVFHPGVRSASDVDAELAARGFIRVGEVSGGPGTALSLGDFLQRLVGGELSYTWNVPKAILHQCLPRLQVWAESRFDLTRSIAMPRELRWTIFRRSSG